MRRLFSILVFAFVFSLLGSSGPLFPGERELAYYLSPAGKDENPGTREKPFASIEKVFSEIRVFSGGEQERTIRIRFLPGTYFLEKPLRIGFGDCPERTRLIFEPAGEGKVVLSGGRPLTNFTEIAPGRWELHLPEVQRGEWYFSQLYRDDYRLSRTVIPENTYYTVEKALSPGQKDGRPATPDRFRYKDSQFRPDWKNLNDVEINTFHKWTMDHLRIKEINAEGKTVVFTGGTHSADQAPLQPTTYYRIENVYEALEKPDQWYLDRKSGVLTVLAEPGLDLNRCSIIAPKLNRILSVEGDLNAGKYVKNVHFENLTFAHTDWTTPPTGSGFPQADVNLDGAITFTAVAESSLKDCIVRHTGNYGLDLGDGCSNIRVESCELFDLGAGGIKIGPTRLGGEDNEKKWCTGITIYDSRIAHAGRVHPEGVGIWIGHANHCRVEFNEIYDLYYSGISVGWKWGPGFSPAHHNIIRGNHIHKVGQGVLNDMAGIYTLGESPGTRLLNNHIHDVRRANYGGWGIYYDESSRGILAENNVVYRTMDGGFHQHYGLENTVKNNIFADAENGLIAISNLQKSGVLTFENNIFYMVGSQDIWEKDQLREDTTFRSNLYWRENGGPITFFGGRDFARWKAEKEPDAQIADPKFVDPGNSDYTLQKDSPAFAKIGFKPIDPAESGRRTKIDKTAVFPVPRAVFPPGIPESSIGRNIAYEEDFENYQPGSLYADWACDSFTSSFCRITDRIAAPGGRKSLEFRKGSDHSQDWQPHLYTHLKYDPGTLRCSFDLRIEKGTQMNMEIRDWRAVHRGGYKVGPAISVHEDGTLYSHGKKLAELPGGQWIHVEMKCETGPRKDDSRPEIAFELTFPDATDAQSFRVPVQEGFEIPTWIGFSTHGKSGTGFFIDHLKLRNDFKKNSSSP